MRLYGPLFLLWVACDDTRSASELGPSTDRTVAASPDVGAPGKAEESKALPFDHLFMDAMLQHHQGGVDMAEIALERAEHAELRALAQGMIAKQGADIERMTAWRQAWYGTEGLPPTAPPKTDTEASGMVDMRGMSDDIALLRTAEPFDRAFLDAMIPHHERAIEMAETAFEKSEHDEIKTLAANIRADQKKEVAQMEDWRDAWYQTAQAMGTQE